VKKYIVGLGIVIAISLFALQPLFGSGLFPVHDDTQVSRVIVMGKALREGQFPVRWVSDLGYGYGYPIFNFYGPLPYYVGGGLYALGMDAVIATKTMFFIGAILAPIFMYIAVASVLGLVPAVVAAVFYMYAPYHAVQLYVRGAVGEYWAYAFVPLLFYGLWGLRNKSNGGKYALIGGVGLAGVIVSHTIAGFIVGIGLGIYTVLFSIQTLINKKTITGVFPLIRLLVLGAGLSAFFWLPALLEKQFTAVEGMLWDKTDYRDHFVCPGQLWNSQWGFGGSAKGCLDGLSFKLGKVHMLGAFAGFLMWIITKKKDHVKIFVSGLVVFLFAVIMTLQISEPVWRIIPFSGYIQYPWRFLAFAAFGSSLLTAGIVFVKQPLVRMSIVIAVLIVTVVINNKVFTVQYTYEKPSSYFENVEDLRFRVSKISDEYLPPEIPRPVSENDIVRGTIVQGQGVSVQSEFESNTYSKYPIFALSKTEIEIRKAYFPGFRYLVNGIVQKPVVVGGIPHLTVLEDRSVVEIFFDNTPVRIIGNTISVLTLLVLAFIYGKKTIC
jgi:hypothetical protein